MRAGLKKIGKDGVSVPEYYYKVLLDNTPPGIKAIGFILPNKESNKPLESFACSVDQVEKMTNIDFFPKLDDKIENTIEARCDKALWFGQTQSVSSNYRNIAKNNSNVIYKPNYQNSNSKNYYIGNTNSHVFHRPTCKNANCKKCTIKFNSAKEAIQAGYHGCSQCKP